MSRSERERERELARGEDVFIVLGIVNILQVGSEVSRFYDA